MSDQEIRETRIATIRLFVAEKVGTDLPANAMNSLSRLSTQDLRVLALAINKSLPSEA